MPSRRRNYCYAPGCRTGLQPSERRTEGAVVQSTAGRGATYAVEEELTFRGKGKALALLTVAYGIKLTS